MRLKRRPSFVGSEVSECLVCRTKSSCFFPSFSSWGSLRASAWLRCGSNRTPRTTTSSPVVVCTLPSPPLVPSALGTLATCSSGSSASSSSKATQAFGSVWSPPSVKPSLGFGSTSSFRKKATNVGFVRSLRWSRKQQVRQKQNWLESSRSCFLPSMPPHNLLQAALPYEPCSAGPKSSASSSALCWLLPTVMRAAFERRFGPMLPNPAS